MKLSEIYSQKINHLKEIDFNGSKIKVKLFIKEEAEEFAKYLDDSDVDLFLSKSIFENNEKSLFDEGKVSIFKNMPNAHKQELMKIVTIENGGQYSIEEKKRN